LDRCGTPQITVSRDALKGYLFPFKGILSYFCSFLSSIEVLPIQTLTATDLASSHRLRKPAMKKIVLIISLIHLFFPSGHTVLHDFKSSFYRF
jgi:hypothetical protein